MTRLKRLISKRRRWCAVSVIALTMAVVIVLATAAATSAATYDIWQPKGTYESATIGGALFETYTLGSGTGNFHPFLSFSSNDGVEEGYNTDADPRADPYLEDVSDVHTHSLAMMAVPVVKIGDNYYWELICDTNQSGSNTDLTIEELEVYAADSATITGYPFPAANATMVWDFDGDEDNTLLFNGLWGNGSGTGDLRILIPYTPGLFTSGKTWFVVYAKMGNATYPCNDGFEEFGIIKYEPTSYLTVDKITVPSGSLQGFNFTLSGYHWVKSGGDDVLEPFTTPFSLTDTAAPYQSVPLTAGVYTVTETLPDGWTLTDISGEDSSSGSTATVFLAFGESRTITFTDTQKSKIIVDKVTDPSGSSQLFEFNPSWSESNFYLDDDDTPYDSGWLVPGTYSVDELGVTGW
ncbi:MAG: hypothetical protein QUS33_08600, partial [Dehalococcoidia bacterium]|nr:hypothetical protein [Dehalococcoidia bacterium]